MSPSGHGEQLASSRIVDCSEDCVAIRRIFWSDRFIEFEIAEHDFVGFHRFGSEVNAGMICYSPVESAEGKLSTTRHGFVPNHAIYC